MNEAFKDISVPPVPAEDTLTRRRRLAVAFHYALAVLYSGFGLIVLELITFIFPGEEPPIILLALCVTAAAWHGGFGPGFVATLLVALGSWGLLIPPEGFAMPHPTQVMRLALIVASGSAVSWLAEGLRRTMDLLQGSERRLRVVLDTAALGIVEYDRDDQIILANKHFLKLLSYPLAALRGKSMRELTPPEDRPPSDDLTRKLHDGILPIADYDTQYLSFNGTPLSIHATVAPIRDMDGRFLGSIGTIEDITDRLRYERERDTLLARLAAEQADWKRTFDTVPDLIGITDQHHKFIRVNKAMAERLGLSAEDCVGLACHASLYGIVSPPENCPHFISMKTVTPQVGEFFSSKLGGHFLMSVTPFHDAHNRIIGSVLVARDISERKRAEENLARSNRDLEQFANIVSHDLQEPLRMVASFGDLLKERLDGKLDAEAQEYLAFIRDGALRMSTLIKGLLDYSRVERSTLVPVAADTQAIVRDVLNNLRVAIDAAHASIQTGPLPVVTGNPTQLLQLFQNLIENALKYRKPDTAPEIAIRAEKQDGSWLFKVNDNGIGIAPDCHARIFDLFQRLHPAGKYEGAGIGLAVCKKIVERHGGRIWVESADGLGSTFLFILPGAKP